MESFIIDVPVPSMGATVSELNVIAIRVKTGEQVAKGQHIADLESDKSTFEYESPCDGVIIGLGAQPGQTLTSGQLFCSIQTSDESQRHLARTGAEPTLASTEVPAPKMVVALIWTPRATKLAQEAGLDPATITNIEATGPGNRVSGDDVQRYLAMHKS